MAVNVERLNAIIAEYYPEDCREILAAQSTIWRERIQKDASRWKDYFVRPAVFVTDELGTGNMSIIVSATGLGHILTMHFKSVEKCCAMCFAYNFTVAPNINPELLKKLMDEFLKGRSNSIWTWFTSRRLIINMVEQRAGNHFDPMTEVVPVENPKVNYQPLFDYFHQNARVRTMLMPNHNNGNIIHHMEVVFPSDYFDKV
jgi:hypothetical protein